MVRVVLSQHKAEASVLESVHNSLKRVKSRFGENGSSIGSLWERQGFTLDGLVFPLTSKKSCFVQLCHRNANPFSIKCCQICEK